jgi:hypothetical protein
MSSFKIKDKKVKNVARKTTLDAKHNKIMTTMINKKNSIEKLKSVLNNSEIELKEVQKDLKDLVHSDNCEERFDEQETLIQKKIDLKDKIIEIEAILKETNNDRQINKYLLKTFDILHQYYDENIEQAQKSNSAQITDKKKASPVTNKIKKREKGLVDFEDFDEEDDEDDEETIVDEIEQKNATLTANDLCNYIDSISTKTTKDIRKDQKLFIKRSKKKTLIDYIDVESTTLVNRGQLLDDYNKIVDPSQYKPKSKNIDFLICHNCKKERQSTPSEGTIVCQHCGISESVTADNEKPSYKDPPPENGSFAYKRINHLNEFLAQFQAKESTDIPQDVIDAVVIEIKKHKMTKDLRKLTYKKMRQFLSRHGFADYYEHIQYIKHRITGIPPPHVNDDLADKVRKMFIESQKPFDSCKSKKRRNFLSYPYTISKIFELLGRDDLVEELPKLRNKQKLYDQDVMWKKICKINGWPFIRSI